MIIPYLTHQTVPSSCFMLVFRVRYPNWSTHVHQIALLYFDECFELTIFTRKYFPTHLNFALSFLFFLFFSKGSTPESPANGVKDDLSVRQFPTSISLKILCDTNFFRGVLNSFMGRLPGWVFFFFCSLNEVLYSFLFVLFPWSFSSWYFDECKSEDMRRWER